MDCHTKTKLLICTGFFGLITLSVLTPSLFAQPGNNIGSPSSPTGPFSASLERRYREIALRGVGTNSGNRKRDERVERAALQRLKDDFEQIQMIRLGMIRDIKAGRLFEYKRLSSDAGEIKKRASRLQTSLALFHSQEAGQQPEKAVFNERETQDAASDLCLEISSFIQNPLFKLNGAYRAVDAADAGRSLDRVISLAATIKKSAEILSKSK